MKNIFNIGDVVKLKSGGPSMTVTGIHDNNKTVYVIYFDTYNGSCVTNEFNHNLLVKIKYLNVVKVGNDNLVPSQTDLEKFREIYENALKNENFMQIYHYAVSLERWEVVYES